MVNRRYRENVGKVTGKRSKDMDLRIEKTERGIKNAFIALRSKKPLEKITVRELCEYAQINKSTFYSHYKDIYDLSDTIEAEVVRSITGTITRPEDIMENPARFTKELMLAFISQNSLINILFSGSRGSLLADKIEMGIKEMIFQKYPEYREDVTRNIILSYCIQGAYHAYQGNRAYDVNAVISVISDITEMVKPLYEVKYDI